MKKKYRVLEKSQRKNAKKKKCRGHRIENDVIMLLFKKYYRNWKKLKVTYVTIYIITNRRQSFQITPQ